MDNENIMTTQPVSEQEESSVTAEMNSDELAAIEHEFDLEQDRAAAERHKRAAYASRRRQMERQQAIEKAVLKEREANQTQLEKYKALASKAAQDEVQRELAKIHEADPSINTVADLLNLPNSEDFSRNVRRGLSLSEAYYLTNREALINKARSMAKHEAVSQAMSKSHLTATATRPAGARAVPGDLMAMYRTLNPNATAAQIQRHYNDYLNN